MSRNLCRTSCYICDGEVAIVGPIAPITKEQAMVYYEHYIGMHVADALCTACGAKYLAWTTTPPHWPYRPLPECGFHDLSFRAAFNDEPAPEDLPTEEHVRSELQSAAEKVAGLAKAMQWLEYYGRIYRGEP